MAFLEDFKKFVLRGNVVDMAVGIIIGAAFTTIVKSLVEDIINPPLGLLIGGVDFSKLGITLKAGVAAIPATATSAAVKAIDPVVIRYGVFINNVINFLIVAAVVFMLIKMISALEKALEARAGKTPPPPGEPTEKACPECLSMIPIKATRCAHCCAAIKP